MNTRPVRILYMEDDPGLARLMQKRLSPLGYDISIARDGQQGLEMAATGDYDLLAIDYELPVYDGLQVLARLAAQGPLPPCIIITGTGSEELAVEALKIGACDYLVKDLDIRYLNLLPAVIERALQQHCLEKEKQSADEALRRAHEQLQATLDALPDLLFEIDRQGVIYDFRAPNPQLLYAPPEQFLGRPMGEIIPREAMEVINAAVAQAARTGPHHGSVYSLALPDGEHWFELSIAPKGNPDAAEVHFVILVRDISDRKRAQEAEHQQRILAEALRDTAAALNSSLDLEQVLDAILTNASQVEAYDYANILLLNEQGAAHIVRQTGLTQIDPETVLGSVVFDPINAPIIRQMIETGQPVIISDTAVNPDLGILQMLYPVRSYAGMPIQVQGQVVGFINLISATPNFFTPTHMKPLRTFADQAGVALTNARLVTELRRANEQLQGRIDEIQALQNELRHMAIHDPLTNLYNRHYLQDALTRDIARAERERQAVSIIIMDIDFFKSVNDSYGHVAGDLLLQKFAGLVKSLCRDADFVCRYGGEEFIVIMPGASLAATQERAELIRSKFEALRVPYEGHLLHATISLGIASYPQHSRHSEDLLILADRALYRAKGAGRNRVVTYQDEVNTPPPQVYRERSGGSTPE